MHTTTMFSNRNLYVLNSQPKDKTINEQLDAWFFATAFRTTGKANIISLWSRGSMNDSFVVHIRSFRIPRIATSVFLVCQTFYQSIRNLASCKLCILLYLLIGWIFIFQMRFYMKIKTKQNPEISEGTSQNTHPSNMLS